MTHWGFTGRYFGVNMNEIVVWFWPQVLMRAHFSMLDGDDD